MNNKISLLIFLGVWCIKLYSKDIFVREFGLDGAFETITEAIDSAENGDVIHIEAKPGGGAYTGDLIIEKSLTITSLEHDEIVSFNGDIRINVSGGNVRLMNLKTIGGIVTDTLTPLSSLTKLRILNIECSDVSISDGYDVVFSLCKMQYVEVYKGDFYGNTLRKLTYKKSQFNYPNNKVYFYKNLINRDDAVGLYTMTIDSDYQFFIKNNSINAVRSAIYLKSVAPDLQTEIYNNHLSAGKHYHTDGRAYCVLIDSTLNTTSTIRVYNNETEGYRRTSLIYGLSNLSTNKKVDFMYNNMRFHTGVTIGDVHVSSNMRDLHSAEDKVDRGHPSKMFYDLDKTRNDVGTGGGSYAQFYFDESAVIYKLELPSVILKGEKISIEAEAFDK